MWSRPFHQVSDFVLSGSGQKCLGWLTPSPHSGPPIPTLTPQNTVPPAAQPLGPSCRARSAALHGLHLPLHLPWAGFSRSLSYSDHQRLSYAMSLRTVFCSCHLSDELILSFEKGPLTARGPPCPLGPFSLSASQRVPSTLPPPPQVPRVPVLRVSDVPPGHSPQLRLMTQNSLSQDFSWWSKG